MGRSDEGYGAGSKLAGIKFQLTLCMTIGSLEGVLPAQNRNRLPTWRTEPPSTGTPANRESAEDPQL